MTDHRRTPRPASVSQRVAVLALVMAGVASACSHNPDNNVPTALDSCLQDVEYTPSGWRIGKILPDGPAPATDRTAAFRICYDPYDASAASHPVRIVSRETGDVVKAVRVEHKRIAAGTTAVMRSVTITLTGRPGHEIVFLSFERAGFDPSNARFTSVAVRVDVSANGVSISSA
jgi:hypothetical protein